MLVAGSSAPASGGEHLISHYIDMKSALYGTAHDLHGSQVGVATVYCLGLWERIMDLDPNPIDLESLNNRRLPDPAVRELIEQDWGARSARSPRLRWDEKKDG